MAKLESSIQSDILTLLRELGYYAYKHPPYPTGITDIHAFKNGKHYWFEVKRNKAEFRKKFKNKAIQKLRRKHIREAGDVACVVWSLEQVLNALSGTKIPKLRR